MKKIILIAVIITIAFVSCIDVQEKNKRDVDAQEISKLESKYFSDEQYTASKNNLDTMVLLYGNFIEKYKDDSLTVYYMFKQANLYSALQDYKSAIRVFNDICTNYPDFENRPEALFYEAMIYGDYLKNEVLAEVKYKEFIQDYPNHALRDDAEKSIEFLGKTDAEIIEILTKKDTIK